MLVLLFLREQLADKKASRIVQTLISGILVGGIYGLVALGIVVINKASGVFNFAHGWMMVVGGMIFWSFFTVAEISLAGAALLATATMVMIMTTVSVRSLLEPRNLLIAAGGILAWTLLMTIGGIEMKWLHAIVGTFAGAILTGLAVERFTIRPLIGQPLFTAVLMTLALAEVLHGVTQIGLGHGRIEPACLRQSGHQSAIQRHSPGWPQGHAWWRGDCQGGAGDRLRFGDLRLCRVHPLLPLYQGRAGDARHIGGPAVGAIGRSACACHPGDNLGGSGFPGEHCRCIARWRRWLVAEYQLRRAACFSGGTSRRLGIDMRRFHRWDNYRHRRAIWHFPEFVATGRHGPGALCAADAGAGYPAGRTLRRKTH